MTPNDEQLKKLALAATPGEWSATNSPGDWGLRGAFYVWAERNKQIAAIEYSTPYYISSSQADLRAAAEAKANGCYIARANPSTVLGLLHRLEVAERALEIAAIEMGDKSAAQTVIDWRAQAERELEGK